MTFRHHSQRHQNDTSDDTINGSTALDHERFFPAPASTYDNALRLFDAIAQRSLDEARALLDQGADANAIGKHLNTPLHAATRQGNLEMVRLLLSNHATPDTANDKGFTPLHIAVKLRLPYIAASLITHGANIFAQDTYQRTPLHIAAQYGSMPSALVKHDIERGTHRDMLLEAQLDAVDRNHQTPLHVAAKFGHIRLARFFVEWGADCTLRDKYQRTPEQVAKLYGRPTIAKYVGLAERKTIRAGGIDNWRGTNQLRWMGTTSS